MKTLTDRQQNGFCILEKNHLFDLVGCLNRYNSRIVVASSGLVEFYIADFWIIE